LKALILAAGLGTRLMPLTAHTPKALVRVSGMTLLEIAIRKLAFHGFSEIVVNVHHHARQVVEYLEMKRFGNLEIAISDESDYLLDTGGAILKARWFLDGKEPFLVHNVDVISSLDLRNFYRFHLENNALVTVSVTDRQTKRYFLFDDELRLRGWTDTSSGEIRLTAGVEAPLKKLAFSGIHVINPGIFDLFEEQGRFSIIDAYLRLAGGHPIYGFIQPGMSWFDVGKPAQLEDAEKFLRDHPDKLLPA
jgi:NDP-sugar pyrophosphorylase family protein